jgi:hypothetical protein
LLIIGRKNRRSGKLKLLPHGPQLLRFKWISFRTLCDVAPEFGWERLNYGAKRS